MGNTKYRYIKFYYYFLFLGNGVGDRCDDDFDLDDVPNYLDNCPNNSKIYSTDFRYYLLYQISLN